MTTMSPTTATMTTPEVVTAMTAAFRAGVYTLNLFIQGEPGTGKTAAFRAAAKTLNIPCTILACANRTVEDFGFPDLLNRPDPSAPVEYAMPHWWPTGPCVLVFDDLPVATPDVQKVLAHLICEREMHGHRLPDGVMVGATGNRAGDRAGAARPFTHLVNRMAVIQHRFDVEAWRVYAASIGLPDELIAFSRWKPELIQNFDPQRDQNPTARAWADRVAPIIGVMPQPLELPYISGCVGDGAAVTFCGFLREYRNLPDIDAIWASPQTAMVPATPGGRYAVCKVLADRVTPATMDALVTYLDRMPDDYKAAGMSLVAQRNDDGLVMTPAYTRWFQANGARLLF